MNNNPYSSKIGELIRRFCIVMTKLLALNFLTFICCIPVVTMGAAFAAMHGCLIRLVRKADLQTGTEFFQSFRSNLKQATLLWLPFLLIFTAAQINVLIVLTAPDILPEWVVVPAVSAAIAAFLLFQFVMPVQARFENTPLLTLRSAAILAVSYFPKTILMALLWAVPVVLFWSFTLSWPLIVLFGISLPAYLCARLYNPIFLVLEENQEKGQPEENQIEKYI